MLAELAVAAAAMYVWLGAEPGLVRTLAFDAMLVGGVSTVLFNANPLMRLDGYYMLADWLEIPNLRQRASAYAGALIERHAFGSRLSTPAPGTRGEHAWLLAYAVASLAYRPLVVWALFVAVAQRSFALGVVFAALAGAFWIVAPLAQGAAHVLASPRLRAVRGRAVLVTLALVVGVASAVGFVPVRYRSRAEGVIWVPEEAAVRAGADGFVERIVATPGARVARGDVLLILGDSQLPVQILELQARLRELDARVDERRPTDAVRAEQLRDERRFVERGLADARRRAEDLLVRSATDGTFVVASPDDLPGRYLRKGDLIGYAVDLGTVTVRAVVPQDRIDLVLRDTEAVHVRLAERLDTPIAGSIRRAVPAASERLPAAALGSGGGGRIAVDPRDASGTTALQRLFQVDIELDTPARLLNVGGRAYVRFDHGVAPLATQWYQDMRQLFLTRIGV
jgi:putative peptide zinc metalloprotease protein